MGKYLWLAVTADEYELPIAVADTAKELGKIFGVSADTVMTSIHYGSSGVAKGYKYAKVLNRGQEEQSN